jgi:hypothetical protein
MGGGVEKCYEIFLREEPSRIQDIDQIYYDGKANFPGFDVIYNEIDNWP